jgi:hypothetical protein
MGHCLFSFPDFEFTDYESQMKVKTKYCRQYHHEVGYVMTRSRRIRPVFASEFRGSIPYADLCGP